MTVLVITVLLITVLVITALAMQLMPLQVIIGLTFSGIFQQNNIVKEKHNRNERRIIRALGIAGRRVPGVDQSAYQKLKAEFEKEKRERKKEEKKNKFLQKELGHWT